MMLLNTVPVKLRGLPSGALNQSCTRSSSKWPEALSWRRMVTPGSTALNTIVFFSKSITLPRRFRVRMLRRIGTRGTSRAYTPRDTARPFKVWGISTKDVAFCCWPFPNLKLRLASGYTCTFSRPYLWRRIETTASKASKLPTVSVAPLSTTAKPG